MDSARATWPARPIRCLRAMEWIRYSVLGSLSLRPTLGGDRMNQRFGYLAFLILLLSSTTIFGVAPTASAQVQKIGDPPEARNMRLLGYNDLQARSAYQPIIVRQGDRYLAYIG